LEAVRHPAALDLTRGLRLIVAAGDEVGDEVVAYIARYEPSRRVRTWALIAEFVRHVVVTISPESTGAAGRYLTLMALYVDWCVLTEGATPNDKLLTDSRVRHFMKQWGRTRSPDWIAQSRLRFDELLRRYHDRVDLSKWEGGRHNPRPYPPYTVPETARLRSWARSQRQPEARRNADAITLLGLGFGLRGTEMVAVHFDDFEDHGADGIQLTLQDRFVWCDADYEQDLRTLLEEHRPGDPLTTYRVASTLTNYLTSQRKTRPHTLVPIVNRMRSTWFLQRASHLTALTTVMRAYGVGHISTLHALVPYLANLSPTDARSIMRTTNT